MSAPRTRRGAAALEFALTLPLLLAIFVGIVEYSLLMHRANVVSRAARDACRTASLVLEGAEPTGDLIEETARRHGRFALSAAGVDCAVVACSIRADWSRRGEWMMLRVDIDVPYRSLTRVLPGIPTHSHGSFVLLTQQQIFTDQP